MAIAPKTETFHGLIESAKAHVTTILAVDKVVWVVLK